MIDIELALLIKLNSHSLDSSENAFEILGFQYVQCLSESCQMISIQVSCLNALLKISIKMRKKLVHILSSIDLVSTKLVGAV